MAQLHVVNASVAEPVFAALAAASPRAEHILESCQLNPTLLDSATGLMPLHAGEKLLVTAQRYLGSDTFTFDTVSRHLTTQTNDIANIPLSNRITALDAVKTFVHGLDHVLTGTKFFWFQDSQYLWISRTTSTTEWSDDWSVVQYNLSVILNGMRALFGSHISPVAATIATCMKPKILPVELRNIPIHFAARYTGLAFHMNLLAIYPVENINDRLDDPTNYQHLKETEPEHIEKCIGAMLGAESNEQLANRAAKAFGLSKRTYHRRLNLLGISHSTLVSNARIKMAKNRLCDFHAPITEISMELGYNFPGDFSRFFQSRTGLTPSQYRHIKQAESQDLRGLDAHEAAIFNEFQADLN